MKFSLILTAILSHSFLIALASKVPLFQPAAILLLTVEVIGIIFFGQRTDQNPLSLACLVGLAFALVMGG